MVNSNEISDILYALMSIARNLAKEKNLNKLLDLIIQETTKLLNAERATLFLYNKETKQLYSLIAQELEVKEIRMPLGQGIAGYVGQTGEILNIKDAYQDPRFNKNIDTQTGYKTKSILSVPMYDHKNELLGVIQVLNKKDGEEGFDKFDEQLLTSLAAEAAISIENAKLYEMNELMFRSFIQTLSTAIDARDKTTAGHSNRVARYSIAIGKELGLSDEDLRILTYASFLHDIGKIGVSDLILNKPDEFTREEFEIMKKHAAYTKDILGKISFPDELKDIPIYASSHHEKLDGSGYPEGLIQEQIPLFSRIIAIADVFDAMVSYDRPYKPALSLEKAIEILEEGARTGKFDPKIAKLFIEKKLYKIEKREFVRINLNLSLSYKILSQEDLKMLSPVVTQSKNISAKGLLFESDKHIPEDSYLEVNIYLPQFTMTVLAKVVHSTVYEDKYKIGIKFLNMSEELQKKLTNYLVELVM